MINRVPQIIVQLLSLLEVTVEHRLFKVELVGPLGNCNALRPLVRIAVEVEFIHFLNVL